MLRASSQLEESGARLTSLADGGDSGLPGGDELLHFAEVALGDDADAIATAREGVRAALGEAEMVDAAGVIANFQRMVRIADGTGIPLDEPVLMLTEGIRDDLGINAYGGQENSPRLPWFKRLLGRIVAPFTAQMFKRFAYRGRRAAADESS